MMLFVVATRAQTADRVLVQGTAPTPKKQLRIAYGATNSAYRQQILALVPLGSSYEQVVVFAQGELQTETHPADSMFDPAIIGEHNTPRYVAVETRLSRAGGVDAFRFRRSDLQAQPPHAKIFTRELGFIKGTEYMLTHFQAKPFPLGAWINVGVFFVFDHEHRLVDVCCFAGGRSVTGP